MRVSSHKEVKTINGKRVATTEYRSWQAMKNRTLNPKTGDYRYYGGRGITICKRWHLYENFLADMGRKPTPLHSLDRKNVNKHYCKGNCRRATKAQQAQNRTDTRFSLAKAERIRKLYASGKYFQYELAAIYSTSQAAISQITRNAAWRSQEVHNAPRCD